MAKNYVSEGDVLNVVAGAAIAAGDVVLLGKRIGVALAAIAVGETGAASVSGIWTINKLGTDVVAQGDLLYWDNTAKRLTTTVGTNTLAGYAAKAAGNGALTVDIKLNA